MAGNVGEENGEIGNGRLADMAQGVQSLIHRTVLSFLR
jgi:hypothetical protein